jgi:hypothetical protein
MIKDSNKTSLVYFERPVVYLSPKEANNILYDRISRLDPELSLAIGSLVGELSELSTDHHVDTASFVKTVACLIRTYRVQNLKYGSNWKTTRLGVRGMLANADGKFARLTNMMFDLQPDKWNNAKIVETLRDLQLYFFFMVRLMELHHPFKEEDVWREVEKT